MVGGLIAFTAAHVLSTHTHVLAVAHDVPVGATITAADLTTASLSTDPALAPIPASDTSQIVGLVARVGLVKGELLTRAQLGPSSGFSSGQLVALPLKQGQFPARGLTPGQQVLIVATPGTNAPSTTSPATYATGSSGEPADVTGTVAEVGPLNQATQVTVIDVQVSAHSGVAVAQLASTGNLALILLPTGQ